MNQKELKALAERLRKLSDECIRSGALGWAKAFMEAADALDQLAAQQESAVPVCWANINKQGDVTHTSNRKDGWSKTPLYLHPDPQIAKMRAENEALRRLIPPILFEAWDYGQFADDLDRPLAKPIRKAIRDMLDAARPAGKEKPHD